MRKHNYLRIRRIQKITKGFLIIILLILTIIIKIQAI
jgi:hypothetical protein